MAKKDAVLDALKQASQGLLFPSETDAPLSTPSRPATMSGDRSRQTPTGTPGPTPRRRRCRARAAACPSSSR